MEKRKFGKKYTVFRGFSKGVDLDELAWKLKAKFACGGTSKDNRIELQGDHKPRAKRVLMEFGFPEEMIEVKNG